MSKLRTQLLDAMAPKQVFRAPVWGNPRAMGEALRDVRKALSAGEGSLPQQDLVQASLRKFAMTLSVASFTELKYVCYGITVPVGENRLRLIDRGALFDGLLGLVEQRRGQAKQYRRCYQGLLHGYFGFDKQGGTTVGHANWSRLRAYLDEKLASVVQGVTGSGLALDWLQALKTHRNLLADDPCSRYARELQRGNSDKLRAACQTLGISSSSWVWDEALIAYVRAVCDSDSDDQFRLDLAGVLDLINGRVELKLAEMHRTRATALIVARYARRVDKLEHPDLRDTCLRYIGNPWVNHTAWDAHVQHEPARQMVEGWIKRRLIKDFFELLAHDGGADLRRLNYWLKWEPRISDMWFVLGSDARNNRSKAFEELRQRMVGRRRSLDDPNVQNNAFVMRIGPLLVIEFGVTGNACYAFAAADFQGDLDRPLQSIHMLKQRAGATRMSHSHAWEGRFDYDLKKLIQSVPSSRGELPSRPAVRAERADARDAASPTVERSSSLPAKSAAPGAALTGASALTEAQLRVIAERCQQHGVAWEDNRPKKGAFWVLLAYRRDHPGFASLLDSYGFAYTPGKGFWIKDKA